MKLVSFKKNSRESFGVLTPKGIADLSDAFESITEIIADYPENISKAESIIDRTSSFIELSSVELRAPVKPGKILALAGNYAKHIVEAGLKLGLTESPRQTTVPRAFLKPNTVLNHPNAVIPWPVYSREIDYELELAVVIGKTAKCISPEKAKDCIAGYTIANDVSARSVTFRQGREKRPWDEFYDWLSGKWADGFLPLGPCIVTADEIGNPQDLQMMLKVNSEIRQNANTSEMIYSVYNVVSFLSYIMTLQPGDIIATGTPHGVGLAKGNFLKTGDVIECYIEKIGTLMNTLGPEPDEFYEPLKQR